MLLPRVADCSTRTLLRSAGFTLCVLLIPTWTLAQTARLTSICDVKRDPKAFDHRAIVIRGLVLLEFEEFTIHPIDCNDNDTWPRIWLMFGGDVPGMTSSTFNDVSRHPGQDIRIQGISYRLTKDQQLRKFLALLTARKNKEPAYHVAASLSGTFLAGDLTSKQGPKGPFVMPGWGHLGCCYLFVIQKVFDVDSDPPAESDLSGTVTSEDGKPVVSARIISDVPWCCQSELAETVTDVDGHFSFTDPGQILRIRDPRFRPLSVALEPGKRSLRITLEDSTASDWIIPSCSGARVPMNSTFGLMVKFAIKGLGGKIERRAEDKVPVYLLVDHASYLHIESVRVTAENPSNSDWALQGRLRERWIRDSDGALIGLDRTLKADVYFSRQASFLDHDFARYDAGTVSVASRFDRVIDSACLPKKSPASH